MIHYHGGRHSTQEIAVRIWKARHALVSFADPVQIEIAAEVSQSFVLDNGAFTAWTKGEAVDWDGFYVWVEHWKRHPGFDWALIPDVIDGGEQENDDLLAQWPHGIAGVPVWHLHESIKRLQGLARGWPRIALGSSGEYATPGTDKWWQRMNEALCAICVDGKPITKLHGLRMLNPNLFTQLPLASADSACLSRKIGRANWGGVYKEASHAVKVMVLMERIEACNSAAAWQGIPSQVGLFGDMTA